MGPSQGRLVITAPLWPRQSPKALLADENSNKADAVLKFFFFFILFGRRRGLNYLFVGAGWAKMGCLVSYKKRYVYFLQCCLKPPFSQIAVTPLNFFLMQNIFFFWYCGIHPLVSSWWCPNFERRIAVSSGSRNLRITSVLSQAICYMYSFWGIRNYSSFV